MFRQAQQPNKKGFKPLTTRIVYNNGFKPLTARIVYKKGFKPLTTRIVYKKGFKPSSTTNQSLIIYNPCS